MSSRKSSSPGLGGLPSPCNYGERTPLRSLENGNLSISSPRLKSSLEAVTSKGEVSLNGCSPSPQAIPPPSPSMSGVTTAGASYGPADVTFKSFTCPGGEVEISDSWLCAEQSIILPDDQAASTETEDTILSDSMIVQSCYDHIEHPYFMLDVSSADIAEACTSPTLFSRRRDDEYTADNSRVSMKDSWREGNFTCDKGEDTDVTRQRDEMMLPPQTQLSQSLLGVLVISTSICDNSKLFEEEEEEEEEEGGDHLYSTSVNHVPATKTSNGLEIDAHELNDVTLKSFICTGGEIEIPDGIDLMNETVPLPTDDCVIVSTSNDYSINQSVLHDEENGEDHSDHPYYCNESFSSNLPAAQEPPSCSSGSIDEVKQTGELPGDTETAREDDVAPGSFIGDDAQELHGASLSVDASTLPDDQCVVCQLFDDDTAPTSATQNTIDEDCELQNCELDNKEVISDSHSPVSNVSVVTSTSSKPVGNEHAQCEEREASKQQYGDSALHPELQKTDLVDCTKPVTSKESPISVEVQQFLEHISQVHSSCNPSESIEAKDSALGSSGQGSSAEKLQAERLPDVLKALSQCPSLASALQLGIFSPVVRRASLCLLKLQNDPHSDNCMAEDPLVSPVMGDLSGVWAEHLESPMPRPLFNSTALGHKTQAGPVAETERRASARPQAEAEKPLLNLPLISDGPLQQQLRQMAEFLLLASGKMGPAGVSASVPPPASVTVPKAAAAAVAVSHSVCVGTSAVELVDHSINTSGQFERKREFSVADSCTLTDPLLWNVPPGSLEGLPRQELEQRLQSSMIMVEALLQQLTSARAQRPSCTGPAPSELREKLVQTDHTELSQTSMYQDLYTEALSRIRELELDGGSLQSLTRHMQDTRVTMTSVSSDTDAALTDMKEIRDIVREDHGSLVSHYAQMKALLERAKGTQTQMVQKVRDALHQRNDMRAQMEEAFAAKEAAFNGAEQLRTRCATDISELQSSLGSQQELLAALNHTYPEQVALNQTHTETLNSAVKLLSEMTEEQSTLMKEVCTVRGLLQKTTPLLLKLNDKAAVALRERDDCISARDQAVEEREQIEEELNQTNVKLQSAGQQIGDLNLQLTISSSEMGVLRQKLTDRDEERGQLERKVTELSATVSSTLASYTFLEQALASETTKLQQSWKDIQQAKDRANELEMSQEQWKQRESKLSQALARSEEAVEELQVLLQSQKLQIQQLQEVCTQVDGMREMNEFLQMEDELAREQVAESERLLRANLQALRERNIQCEDLKTELGQLQVENRSLQEQLETTTSRASATQLELGEKFDQVVTEITLLHHTLRGLTNQLHAALSNKNSEKDDNSQNAQHLDRRHLSNSFVDRVMVALSTEKEEDDEAETTSDPEPAVPQCDTLFSERSAFSRVPVTPKKNLNSAAETEPEEEEDQSSVAELLADLGTTVTELGSTMKLLHEQKDGELQDLHNTVSGLQEEQQAASGKHQAEVFQLQRQLTQLNGLVTRGNQALQQKAQDDKTLASLSAEVQGVQEYLNKYKANNNELRKEVADLRRSLQTSKLETECLREAMTKAGDASAHSARFMDDKIQLLKEVERLKSSLQEAEQARGKLLERAKRHQMIHQSNQQKSENELQMLNRIINKVRESLLSLPEVVKNSEQLQQLIEYIG